MLTIRITDLLPSKNILRLKYVWKLEFELRFWVRVKHCLVFPIWIFGRSSTQLVFQALYRVLHLYVLIKPCTAFVNAFDEYGTIQITMRFYYASQLFSLEFRDYVKLVLFLELLLAGIYWITYINNCTTNFSQDKLTSKTKKIHG